MGWAEHVEGTWPRSQKAWLGSSLISDLSVSEFLLPLPLLPDSKTHCSFVWKREADMRSPNRTDTLERLSSLCSVQPGSPLPRGLSPQGDRRCPLQAPSQAVAAGRWWQVSFLLRDHSLCICLT